MTKIQTGQGTIPLQTLIAIWSISAVVSLPGLAISPILGHLDKIFSHTSQLEIQMLTSLPSLLIIPCVLLAGQLSVRFDKIRILFWGLSLFFISGVLCFFAKNMWQLITINCILGIGAGMVIPLPTGLIADYFSGKYRVKQLGISSSISNITLVLATSLTGWLATVSWHLPFLVYTLPGISILLCLFLRHPSKANSPKTATIGSATTSGSTVAISGTFASETTAPETAPSTTAAPETISSTAVTPGAATLGTVTPGTAANPLSEYDRFWLRIVGPGIDMRRLGSLMVFYLFATYAVLVISFNLPFLIQQYKLTSSASGIMISLFFLAIMLPGLFINQIIAKLQRNTVFTALILIFAGLLLIFLLKNEISIGIGCFATGLGYGILQPLIYDKAVRTSTPIKATLALALVMSVNYLAILICPFIVAFFSGIFHSKSSDFPFALNAALTLIALYFCYKRRDGFTFGAQSSDN